MPLLTLLMAAAGAAAAAAIPVAIHLLHRRKPKPVPFSALRFVREAVAKTRRSRHLTQIVTLLLRMSIMALLVLAFFRPTVRFTSFLPQGPRTVIVVLDASASMQCRDGENTSFARARAWALDLLGSLDSGDSLAIVAPGLPSPWLIYPPNSDHEAVGQALQEVEPGFGRAYLVRTLRELVERLDKGRHRGVEIHVFSDFQRSDWDAAEAEGLSTILGRRQLQIPLFLNHVQPNVVANAGISRTDFHPPAVLGEGEVHASAQVISSADYRGESDIRLFIEGEERTRQTFTLMPAQTVTQSLSASVTVTRQYVTGRLELPPDAFTPDNTFEFSLPSLPGIPILLVDGSGADGPEARDTFFLRFAIQPRGKARTLFQPRVVDWAGFASGEAGEAKIVFVCNPPELSAGVIGKLERYTVEGGTLVLMPGGRDGVEKSVNRLGPFAGMEVRKETLAEERAGALVASAQPGELEKRITAIVPTMPTVVVRRRLLFSNLPEGVRPVYHYAGGGPFMLEAPWGQGRVLVSSVSANRDWSEWPLTPAFVICQQELTKDAARANLPVLSTRVGEGLALAWPEDTGELDFRMTDPHGRSRTVTTTRRDSQQPVLLNGFSLPGLYGLERNGRERLVAVNLPEAESELTFLETEELAYALRQALVHQAVDWRQQQQQLADLRQGRPLWPLLLALAFFLVVAEELFANFRSQAAGLPESLQQFLRRGRRLV